MYCPKKFNSSTINPDGTIVMNSCYCETTKCEWWNRYYEKCSIALDGYLKAKAEQYRESYQAKRNG